MIKVVGGQLAGSSCLPVCVCVCEAGVWVGRVSGLFELYRKHFASFCLHTSVVVAIKQWARPDQNVFISLLLLILLLLLLLPNIDMVDQNI